MTKPLTELFEEAVEFNDDALSDIHKRYNNDRRRYLAKNGVGLFGCGAAAEADRRKPIDLATKKLIEALEFYADENNWNRDEGGWRHDMIESDLDDETLTKWDERFSGRRARQALAEFRASLEDKS